MQGTGEGIGYRQARFVEMNEMKAWRSCQEQALKLMKPQDQMGSASQYFKCRLLNFVRLRSVHRQLESTYKKGCVRLRLRL